MSPLRYILASLAFHWRSHAALALGVATASAVLAGALYVGDSMRGSLRDLTLDRLGRIDQILVADRFFREKLAEETKEQPGFDEHFDTTLPAILMPATVTLPDKGTRAGKVSLLGADIKKFWSFGGNAELSWPVPASDEIVLNATLAAELGVPASVKPEDNVEVIARLPKPDAAPAEGALGRKTDNVVSRRLHVIGVVPDEGLARFSLSPNQQSPPNAFTSLETLQSILKQPDRANTVFVTSMKLDFAAPESAAENLQAQLAPTFEDYGLTFRKSDRGYIALESTRMLLEPPVERAALAARREGAQPVMTYLANTIANGEKSIAYSTIAAIDFTAEPPLGPLNTVEGAAASPLKYDEIALNAWAAEHLDAKVGDTIRIVFFEPESAHGVLKEREATFKLAAVLALEGAAADQGLTPELPGVTDQLSIGEWDPPFPYEPELVTDADEKYWDDYKATPKAFVSLAAGRMLWQSRFGRLTSIRWPGDEPPKLALKPNDLGFTFRSIKREGLIAANGATSFNDLFLGFSAFIIVAAVLLVALLFRLGVERRAREIGVLLATGVSARRVRWFFLVEGFVIALIGGALGSLAGIGYAWLMLTGLQTWWLAAIVSPILKLHLTWRSGLIGFAAGVIISLLAIYLALREMRRASTQRLLAGQAVSSEAALAPPARWTSYLACACAVLSLVSAASATTLTGEAQAGAFMGAGMLALAALLTFIWRHWRSTQAGEVIFTKQAPLARFAWRNGARHAGRSTLAVGLVAFAAFIIVAISAFRLTPANPRDRNGGAGGYSLIATTDTPLFHNLNTKDGRDLLGFQEQDQAVWNATSPPLIMSLRVRAGDDASCLNLYQSTKPQILGMPDAFIDRGGFSWAATAAESDAEKTNPWLLLQKPFDKRDANGRYIAPCVIDAATAMYSIHLKGVGSRYVVQDARGHTLTLEVVGLLKNSVLQGSILIAEQQFLRAFPDAAGYRMFLIETTGEDRETEETFERVLGDYGFDAQTTQSRLNDLLAVQNTYLSTFQSLGGLGLLLGAFGLAAAQLRSVLERRGELALLRAVGFSRARLAWLVMFENGALLVGGLAIGGLAALITVAPQILGGEAGVPWKSWLATFAIVLTFGLAAGYAAVRAALSAPLIGTLREE